MERLRSWWRYMRNHLVATIIVVIVLVISLIIAGYWFDWTGFNGYNKVTTTHIISGTNAGTVTRTEEYQPGKGIWDWLQLLGVLAIPVVVGFGAVWFTTRQTRISEANRKQRHETEIQIVENREQEELLRAYFDRISELILTKVPSSTQNIESVVKARTLAALHILNTERKAIVLRFLNDSNLIQYVKGFLYTLDLNHADLYRIDLSSANLNLTNLSGADLSGANLNRADLFTTVALLT